MNHIISKSQEIILLSIFFFTIFCGFGIKNTVFAGQLKSPQLNLSSQIEGNISTSYNFSFIPSSTAPFRSLRIQFCATQAGTCVTPIGMNTQSAKITSANIGIGSTGNSLGVGLSGNTNGVLNVYIPYPSKSQSQQSQISFSQIKNPIPWGVFYARISTYGSNSDGGAVPFFITPSTKYPVRGTTTPVPSCKNYSPCDPVDPTY